MEKHRECTHTLPYVINQPSATVILSQRLSTPPPIYAHTIFPNFSAVPCTEKIFTCLEIYPVTTVITLDFIDATAFM